MIAGLTKRKGVIQNSETGTDYSTLLVEVPLNNMFGYSTELRSATQGKGEFSMEYKRHSPVIREEQEKLIQEFKKKNEKKN